MTLVRRCLLTFLLAGCGAKPGPAPSELSGLLEIDRALASCGGTRGPEPCRTSTASRQFMVAFDSAGTVCRYMEFRLVPLTSWASSFQSTLDTFADRFGESEVIGNRFHQWRREDFTAFVTNQRADYDPPAAQDSTGAVVVGFSLNAPIGCPAF